LRFFTVRLAPLPRACGSKNRILPARAAPEPPRLPAYNERTRQVPLPCEYKKVQSNSISIDETVFCDYSIETYSLLLRQKKAARRPLNKNR
jgi:hypothetical protein